MVAKKVGFSKTKIWLVFFALFVCGAFVGIGIANWGHAVKNRNAMVETEQNGDGAVAYAIRAFVEKQNNEQNNEQNYDENLTQCQAVERVLLERLHNNDYDCDSVTMDLSVYKKLATYGCDENMESYIHEIDNKNAILNVACAGWDNSHIKNPDAKTCEKIERDLTVRLPEDRAGLSADRRIERAKIYAVMAERGCPENNAKYIEAAKQELEIARAIRDDNFNEPDTIEVVETYKRLKMQRDAQEVFDKVKKLTNPAIDFIMQVEKIINE